jgi:cell wall-associated NlpC family hydrolase
MPIPIWAGHYIGLPFHEHGRDRSGLDCWGLVRLVMAEQFNIALPSHAHEYERTTAVDKISALIERESVKWKIIATGQETCGDVVVLRVRDKHMLHIERGINSVIERYTGPHWSERIAGIYRYKGFYDDSFE